MAELKFLVEEKRSAVDVFTTWFVAHYLGFALVPLILLGAIAATWYAGRD